MAKNISLLGADYPDVPAVQLPQTGGGTATFYDINVIDSLDSDSSTDALSAKQGKALNGKMAIETCSVTSVPTGVTLNNASIRKCVNVISGYVEFTAQRNVGATLGKLSKSAFYPTSSSMYTLAFAPDTALFLGIIRIDTSGNIIYTPTSGAPSSSGKLAFSFTHIINPS